MVVTVTRADVERELLRELVAEELGIDLNKPSDILWTPLPGPQTRALQTEADELFYGGQAGGGKTDLVIGLSLTQHRRSIIFRREYKHLRAIVDRSKEIVGNASYFNNSDLIWRFPDGRVLELGAVQHVDDKENYQGRPHDLKAFDELPQFPEAVYLFLIAWLRTTIPRQRTRVVGTGNPPTTADGEWVIKRWRAWLDPQHSHPALPGELRWYAMIDGEEVEREDGTPFIWKDDTIRPRSRTFIPAALANNPHLEATGYRATLQAQTEPLRSQLLYGDFTIGLGSDPWQVIPTDWIVQAQARWTAGGRGTNTRGMPNPMTCAGADLAFGAGGRTMIAKRFGSWIAPLIEYPGSQTPTGQAAALVILQALTDGGFCNLDVANTGAEAYRVLQLSVPGRSWPISYAEPAKIKGEPIRDQSKTLTFANVRAAMYWKLREWLDPSRPDALALPPDRELRAELAAPKYSIRSNGVLLEEKADITKRLGRSPDRADAVVMSCWDDPRRVMAVTQRQSVEMKVTL